MRRLFLANLGFLTAMGLVLPLVYFEEDLQKNFQNWICDMIDDWNIYKVMRNKDNNSLRWIDFIEAILMTFELSV